MIVRAPGATAKGTLGLFNLAVMPAWGKSTNGMLVYAVFDEYSAALIEDNVVFAPWGWSEARCPAPLTGQLICSQWIDPTKNNGAAAAGGGSTAKIGLLMEFGLYKASQLVGSDNIGIDVVALWNCRDGVVLGGIWQNRIGQLAAYNVFGPAAYFSSGGAVLVGQVTGLG
jgi:hypothetical protein